MANVHNYEVTEMKETIFGVGAILALVALVFLAMIFTAGCTKEPSVSFTNTACPPGKNHGNITTCKE